MTKNFLKLPLSILLFLFVCSCQFSPKQNETILEEKLSPGVDGIQKKYRDDKTLLSAIEHKDRKRHGISRSYYEDGKTVHNEIRYIKGVKSGITNSYYQSGKLYYEVNFEDGKREGMMKKYYDTGELMAEIPFKDNKVQSGLIEYQKSGKKKTIYPHLIFEEIDKTAFENKYTVRVKLSKSKSKVKYYRIEFDENGNEISENFLLEKNGMAEVNFYLKENTSINTKLKIKAVMTTFLRNPYIIYKEKQIKVAW